MNVTRRDWRGALRAMAHPRVITMLFLGLSAGLPLFLIFSSLSLWLREAGLDRATVTFFSWAALGYSFKFVWAPLVDRLPLPVLTRVLGRRRGWMLLSQLCVMAAIAWMALTDPAAGEGALISMAMAAVALGFSSATQDIVIDAYRIESAEDDLQAMMSASYIAGYRVGTLAAGAGALYLAAEFGSALGTYDYQAWKHTYLAMAGLMLVGVITTLVIREPEVTRSSQLVEQRSAREYAGFVGLFALAVTAFVGVFSLSAPVVDWLVAVLQSVIGTNAAGFVGQLLRLLASLAVAVWVGWLIARSPLVARDMVVETYVAPVREFFERFGVRIAVLVLLLIGLYRISDIVLGVIANVFYQDLGFTKQQIAGVVKTFGLFMTILGGFVGGVLALRYGVMRVLFAGAVLTVVTNLFFIALAVVGNNELLLYLVISADNLTAGLASAAFVAFLSSLTSVRFTAVQYAVFSSLMTLLPKLVGGYSGTIVDAVGYVDFFIIAALLGVPVLALVWLVGRVVDLDPPPLESDPVPQTDGRN